MSKFTPIQATKDITVNNKVIVRKGTKGLILEIKENNLHYVRFSTGKMLTLASSLLLAL
jgi:hypothetical protein